MLKTEMGKTEKIISDNLEKILTELLSEAPPKSIIATLKDQISYLLYRYFRFTGYNKTTIHNDRIKAEIPVFFNVFEYKSKNIHSIECNYKKHYGIAFALEKSSLDLKPFVTYRKKEAGSSFWTFTGNINPEFNTKIKFETLFFSHKSAPFFKGILICRLDNRYLIITIIAPENELTDKKGVIHRTISSIVVKGI